MALLGVDYDEVVKGKETVLWENPSPTSTFATQTVTLSDDITKYDQIKVVYCYNTSSTTSSSDISSVTCDVREFIRTGERTVGLVPDFTVWQRNANYYFSRIFRFVSNTSIVFGSCIQYYPDSTITTANTVCIPLKIIGVIEGKIEKDLGYIALFNPDDTYNDLVQKGTIYGDFSGYTRVTTLGAYSASHSAYYERITYDNAFTYGQNMKFSCGYYPNMMTDRTYYSWRYVTINEDSIVFGQGGYTVVSSGANYNNNNYGAILGIILHN